MPDFLTSMLRQQSNYDIRVLAGTMGAPGAFSECWFHSPRNMRMTKKTVLAIGIEPSFVDFSAFPGLTTELVRSYIETQIEQLCAMGYEADSCLIDLGDTAEAVAAAALAAKHYDCVVIGAGLREPRERLQLFERIINLIHLGAPQTRICFNTTPADTADAVRRWIAP